MCFRGSMGNVYGNEFTSSSAEPSCLEKAAKMSKKIQWHAKVSWPFSLASRTGRRKTLPRGLPSELDSRVNASSSYAFEQVHPETRATAFYLRRLISFQALRKTGYKSVADNAMNGES